MKLYRTALVLLSVWPKVAIAQTPSPSVSLGFGVDTAIADVRNIVSLVRTYLAKPDSSARTNGLWTTTTDFDRKYGDIISGQVNQGFPATIVGIIPFSAGDSVYNVKILYARYDSTDGIAPLSFERLLAVRESGARFGFRLAGLFPRARRQWQSHTRGPLTFWYVPGQRPDPAKIERASRFVDSVAKLFAIPVPQHLDVIVGKSVDDVNRAIGIDFFPESSGPGQRSGGMTFGNVILSGIPAIGEAYLHEFTHAVLGPSLPVGSRIMGEGVATWLGGSRGRTAQQMYALLRHYQESDSTLRLSTLLRNDFRLSDQDEGSNILYGSSAMIVNAVYRRHGITGVRRLYQVRGDADTIARAIADSLGLPASDPDALDKWWRREPLLVSRLSPLPSRLPQ